MAEANGSSVNFDLTSALNRAQRAYNRAGSAITPEQENKELRVLGDNLMVVGVFNTAVSYRAFINRPEIPNYTHVMMMIPLVIHCFTFIVAIIIMATGWLLIVGDNPRQHGCLVKIILLLGFIASAFTMAMGMEL